MSTVLITGGAKRIGFEIAKFFAKKGYDIALHCNSSIEIATENAKFLQEKFKIRCKAYQFNLENCNEIPNFFQTILHNFPQIDVLVNNASFFEKSSIKNTTLQGLIRNFSVHFFAPSLLCQAFAMQSNLQNGLIINMLDKNTTRTKTQYFNYLQSKKSLLELTKYLAVELAPKIRVNAISPGFIIEEEGILPDASYISHKLSSIPLKKQGSVDDIILAVEYLLNGKYVNGQNLFVDGGAFLLND
jgi:NAD(P)-dependent dehydrogenase (short-subunit alcohol dehydrogenase family)